MGERGVSGERGVRYIENQFCIIDEQFYVMDDVLPPLLGAAKHG